MPRPPALETAEASGAVEVCAMPARRMGWVILSRVVRGVVSWGVVDGMVEVCWAISLRGFLGGGVREQQSDGVERLCSWRIVMCIIMGMWDV